VASGAPRHTRGSNGGAAVRLALLLWFACACLAQVVTSQYDNARTGANVRETILTPANVTRGKFGKLFSWPVDGDVYAQPLYVPGVEIPGKGRHNVVYIATEHNSVYAFDADGQPREPLWKASFLGSGITSVPASEAQCPFIAPEIGITSTPVIDLETGTLYILARTMEGGGFLSSGHHVQKLHALAITTGAEKFGGPVQIKGSVRTNRGTLEFGPLRANPRASLLLVKGSVVLTWASACDVGPYYGWVMVYDARTLAQTAIFNASPGGQESGIWQGDTGPAADAEGNIYVVTGNGVFTAASGGVDFGDTVLKLGLKPLTLPVLDYFTPSDERDLNRRDDDLGSGGPVLLPDQPGAHPHLLVVAGKGQTMYVIDRDRMGKFQSGRNPHALQTVVIPYRGGMFGAPAYWNQHLYTLFSNDGLRDYAVKGGLLSPQAVKENAERIGPGGTPAISANGSRNGIVWVLQAKGRRDRDQTAVLHAYDALDVSRELYSSADAGTSLRFNIPMIANGRVYVGAVRQVTVYGLYP
jgi:hypothetical protein